ncbi:methyltransferase family protein [Tunicatimonas pelagia]|uniref:methyltransferase family protein n=1 Tax=Tunicatimonas pelagia TaxID=931531 RepID=UPI002665BF4D|nr:isoprenylcysteine carboxylmethyltransferase family protein [Tunicatimonas pelagia]WKN45698.1 isoprenylcysteine carboxylmethyltransferase family protein [Tunicatimonas pelagia]
MVVSYLILAGLWLVYFGLHSFLALAKVKKQVQGWLGQSYRYYRLGYNIIAVITLIPILLYNSIISSEPLVADVRVRDMLQLFGLVLASYGVIVIHLSFKQFSKREFLGVPTPAANQVEPLQTDGVLRYVRHPLYAGTILIALGLWCFSPTIANLVTALAWIAYILIGIQLEEKKLLKLYGNEYQTYRQQVPMLIPRLRSR